MLCLLTAKQPAISHFKEYPEALHVSDNNQSLLFNEQLMKKLVIEKKKKNQKFVESKLMRAYFMNQALK